MNFIGKRILITTHSLIDFAGAEVNVLSIAKELKKWGNVVHVGAFQIGLPIVDHFVQNQIPVFNLLYGNDELSNYDLIWAQHEPTLFHLLFSKNISAERIIFSSLSPFEPFEAPPLYSNSLTLCLANSDETKKRLINEKVNENKILVFRNFAPSEFFEATTKISSEKLSRICIVSNHVPNELLLLKNAVESKGLVVDVYGMNYNQQLMTPEILLHYDTVISIGKTVQYALVLGIPVFCYDTHGGPGWLNTDNYDKAKYHNFSGRGFSHYGVEALEQKIIDGYNDGIRDIAELMKKARQEFNLTSNLQSLFNDLRFDNNVVNTKVLLEEYRFLERKHKAFLREYEYNAYRKGLLQNKEVELSEKNTEIEQKDKKIIEMEKRGLEMAENLDLLNQQIIELDKTIKQLKDLNVDLIQKNEENVLSLRKLSEENAINQSKLIEEINKKEENCLYLASLVKEKNAQISSMQGTRMWRAAEKIRRIIIFLKKARNPKLVANKLRRMFFKDYSSQVIIKQVNELDAFENDMVSVVIPIYDRTDVLRTSIESILNQTYQNLELILVCDGSPRQTIEIVKSYENHEKVRAFYFNNNSGNAVRGRNKAIKEARGKYLAFQDSDDIAEPNRLQLSVEYMEKYKVDVVYGGWRALIDGSREIDLKDKQEIFSPDCDYEMLKKICVPCQSTVMVRTDALRYVGGLKTKMRYREDHELWLRLAYFGYKFKSIDKVLTNLRLHANNLELSFKDNDNKWEKLTLSEHTKIEPLKPKIAYLIAGTGISGGLVVICKHVNMLLHRGYDVLIITEDGNRSIDWFPNQQVNVINIDEVPNNLDIVISTYWTTAYTLERIPAKQKYYFVQSDESKFFPLGSNEYTAALNTYTMNYKLITMAKWIQNWLKQEFNRESFYVPNGVDLDVIHSVTPMIEKNGKVRVLIEGPIDVPFKGIKEAFEVVKGLDCEIWCVSTSGKPNSDWHIDKFFEKVPFEKMKDIYSSCDILLKMSKVESFCLPALEMMACGGVCVLNRVNGIDEFVVDGYNALVVEQGDIEAARNAIIRLIEDKTLRDTISTNAKETALKWGWDRCADELEKIYYLTT